MRCSFADMLNVEKQRDVTPIVELWKQLQLACVISIPVLHLYETGWISERLETSDFHFFGSPDSQYLESTQIAPYISAMSPKNPTDCGKPSGKATSAEAETTDTGTLLKTNETTPFDCLRRASQAPSNLLGSKRDERLATLFHKFGIVLFELGRGDHYHNIFWWRAMPDEHVVLAEMDKIHFGRPYRDFVKTCLTGNLHTASEVGIIDAQFNRAVIEK